MTKIPEWWMKDKLVNMLSSLIDYRWKTPTPSETWIITLSAKSVKMWFIDYDQAYHISKETYDKFMTRWFPKKWDILMTTEAPLWCIAKLDRDDVSVAQRLLTLRWKEWELDNNYMMYYLMSQAWQHELLSRMSWSTVWWISRKQFDNVEIILPPLPEQKAIAGVLSAFDDKIELLRAENQTLEEMGQTLFKEWFGKYKIEDELPDGWKVGKQKDLIDLLNWFAYKSSDFVEWWKYKLVTIANVQDGNFVSETKDSLDIIPDKMPEYCHLKTWDILLSLTWNVWRVCLVIWENYFLNQRVAKISPKNENDYWFAYFYFRQKNMITILESISVWTAQQNLSPIKTSELELIIPNRNTLDEFWKVANKLFDKIVKNLEEIQTLAKTRDQLLPKLMSWEVRVEF